MIKNDVLLRILELLKAGYIPDERFKNVFLDLIGVQANGILPLCEIIIDAIDDSQYCDKIVTLFEKSIV